MLNHAPNCASNYEHDCDCSVAVSDYTEIPHDDKRHDFSASVRLLLGETLDEMHEQHVLNAGQQMTQTFTFDCGYKGRIIFQLDAEGDCGS